ncbi:MAG TPA: hypothetical protein VF111_04760, partial [Thermoanaerobaculia bacterium]
MKRIVTIIVPILLIAAAAHADIHGSWTASTDEKSAGRMYLQVNRGSRMNMGTTMNISDFAGLSPAQINAGTSTPVQFELRREAGNVTFDGSFRKGDGAGQFNFVPNRSFFSAIDGLGIRRDAGGDDDDLFSLAMHDVSTAFIRGMHAEGIRGDDLDQYLAMRIHRVTPELVRELRALGFKNLEADELIAARIHRVTPEYIRAMRAAGWDLTLGELQNSRIHGATPEFAEEMKQLGYGTLDHDKLVNFRIHRVTPEFIRELRALGYNDLTADQLI